MDIIYYIMTHSLLKNTYPHEQIIPILDFVSSFYS